MSLSLSLSLYSVQRGDGFPREPCVLPINFGRGHTHKQWKNLLQGRGSTALQSQEAVGGVERGWETTNGGPSIMSGQHSSKWRERGPAQCTKHPDLSDRFAASRISDRFAASRMGCVPILPSCSRCSQILRVAIQAASLGRFPHEDRSRLLYFPGVWRARY